MGRGRRRAGKAQVPSKRFGPVSVSLLINEIE